MDFRIADTFTASLGRLTVQEQKAVKTTAFDLQMDPSAPGLSFHRLDRAKDQNFWSVRVNADIRLIVHKTASSLLLAYVDHHDDAYRWAERRKIERHPTTGAMQLVVVRSREDIPPEPSEPVSARAAAVPVPSKPKLFDNLRRPELLAFGVPDEWIDDVRTATEDTLFDIIAHLPQEAQEALLRLAVGEKPEPAPATPVEADPYAHPDAQRRFRVLTNLEELQQALDAPWERWAVFLHPDQRQLATRPHAGPARVSGSAGTGKTVVALHRTAWLVRSNPDAKVLLTTFSKALANALDGKLRALIGQDPAAIRRVTVRPITGVGYDLYSLWFGQPEIASATLVNALIRQAAQATEGQTFPLQFLIGEWGEVVDAWQLRSWDDYRDVSRLGRKTRIGGKQRELLWSIFQRVHADLDRHKVVTWADLFGRLTARLREGAKPPFDHAVVDEAQDVSIPELRFLAALTGGRRDGLFLAGDLGQRIFQQPFSWKSLGVDVRGRSATLRINYRTSHQFGPNRTGCCPGLCRMSTAMLRAAGVRSRFSTDRPRSFACSTAPRRRSRASEPGSPSGCGPVSRRRRSAYLSAPSTSSGGPERRSRRLEPARSN